MTRSTWGLAIDGSRARILRDLEDTSQDQPLAEELGLDVRAPRPGEVDPHRSGRGDPSSGEARSAGENASDTLRDAERDFCQELLWLLGTHQRRGDFDRIVVAAEPRMLGHLRDRRSGEMAAATVAECPKDYTHLSPADLRTRLRELMPRRLS